MTKFLIVSGSPRKDSESERVARYLQERMIAKAGAGAQVELLSLGRNPLPLWDEDFGERKGPWQNLWPEVERKLKTAEGYIFVVPEQHGMAPPHFKNLLFLAGHTLAHKPALICTVSSGMGGAYVVSDLRAASHKNNLVTYLPEQLVLRNVNSLLKGTEPSSDIDRGVRERIDHDLVLLKLYTDALKTVRSSSEVDFSKYPNGM